MKHRPVQIVLTLQLLLAVTVTCVWSGDAFAQRGNSVSERRGALLIEQRQSLLADLRFELTRLSQACHDQGMTVAAADITAIALRLTRPTDQVNPPRLIGLPINPALPEQQKQWRTQLQNLRHETADQLYRLARSALRNDLPSLAYSLVQDVLRINPDHEFARSVISQQKFMDRTRQDDPTYAGEWVSPFEAQKRSGNRPEVFDSRYGWIPESHVIRYEQGLRPWEGDWISVQKEAELRRNFRNAWEIGSQHFVIRTNTSLEEGVALSIKLEAFYQWMQTNFAAFFDTPEALEERFEKAQSRSRRRAEPKQMQIHYFAVREEYEAAVRGRIPAEIIPKTNGFYWDEDQTCYLFRSEDVSTVFHEATHQILDLHTVEDRRIAARSRMRRLRQRRLTPWVLCEDSDFWIIEGLASYFESFLVHEGEVSVGYPGHPRFVAAQFRLLAPDPEMQFYLPLELFSSLGKEQFQYHPNIEQLYSQASGLTHFLLHYDDGRYRDAFVKLLAAVYRPDPRQLQDQPSLEDVTGVEYSTLDQQYREHLENLAIQLQSEAR